MKPDAVRMGLLYPGGGAEHDYYLFAEAMDDAVKVFMIGTRVGGSAEDDHGVAALLRTAEVDNLVEGARRLVPLRPDVVMWACTSGSFIVGRRGAERQAEALTEVTKAPASSTSSPSSGPSAPWACIEWPCSPRILRRPPGPSCGSLANGASRCAGSSGWAPRAGGTRP